MTLASDLSDDQLGLTPESGRSVVAAGGGRGTVDLQASGDSVLPMQIEESDPSYQRPYETPVVANDGIIAATL